MVMFTNEWSREYKQQQEILSRGNGIIEFRTRIPVLALAFEYRYSELFPLSRATSLLTEY